MVLNVGHFRNGDVIPEATTDEEWQSAYRATSPVWCYYNNSPELGAVFGRLYNWWAVSDPRGLSPLGWHIPTDAEWAVLAGNLASQQLGGQRIPTGERGGPGEFIGQGYQVCFWTAAEGDNSPWGRVHFAGKAGFDRFRYAKDAGLAVFCLKD